MEILSWKELTEEQVSKIRLSNNGAERTRQPFRTHARALMRSNTHTLNGTLSDTSPHTHPTTMISEVMMMSSSRLVCEALNVKHYDSNPRSTLVVDLGMSVLLFADEAQLSPLKTSTLFSLLHSLFESSFSKSETLSRDDSLGLFKQLVRFPSQRKREMMASCSDGVAAVCEFEWFVWK